MRFFKLFLAGLVLICPIALGEESGAGPFSLPAAAAGQQGQDTEWISLYSAELSGLISEALISPQALRLSAQFLRDAELPQDPLDAARMVFVLLVRTDYLVRSGIPSGQIKIRMLVSWKEISADYDGDITIEDVKAVLKDILKEEKAAAKAADKLDKIAEKTEKKADKIDKKIKDKEK